MKKEVRFWSSDIQSGVRINALLLRRFLAKHGFYKLIQSKTQWKLIQIQGKVVSEIERFVIGDYIINYCEEIGNEEVLAAFIDQYQVMSASFLELLTPFEPKFHRDTSNECFIYFKNVVVKITPQEIEFLDYHEIDGYVWDDKIRSFEIANNDGIEAVYKKFISRVAGKGFIHRQRYNAGLNLDRIQAFEAAIGYMIHNHKDPSNARAVILTDMKFSELGEANGRTGKGLIVKAIAEVRNVIIKDGKVVNRFSDKFIYSDITESTDLLYFDDLNKNADFEMFFSAITEGLNVERKYKNAITVPFDRSPKIVISTNHVLKGPLGSSMDARKHELELTDYYNANHTPIQEFKHIFFSDWSEEEFNRFYWYMFNCVRLYLSRGLLECPQINLLEKKLVYMTSREFVEFTKTKIEIGKEYNKQKLFHERFIDYTDNLNVTPHRFTKWLKTYAKLKGLEFRQRESSGNYLFTLKYKEEIISTKILSNEK